MGKDESQKQQSINEQTHNMLQKLCSDFDEHRKEARRAMLKVDTIETILHKIAPPLNNLNTLGDINENIRVLREGLVDQNKTLLGHTGQLIQPNTRTQNMLVNIVLVSIVAVFLLVAFILVRNADKDFQVDRNGFKTTTPER